MNSQSVISKISREMSLNPGSRTSSTLAVASKARAGGEASGADVRENLDRGCRDGQSAGNPRWIVIRNNKIAQGDHESIDSEERRCINGLSKGQSRASELNPVGSDDQVLNCQVRQGSKAENFEGCAADARYFIAATDLEGQVRDGQLDEVGKGQRGGAGHGHLDEGAGREVDGRVQNLGNGLGSRIQLEGECDARFERQADGTRETVRQAEADLGGDASAREEHGARTGQFDQGAAVGGEFQTGNLGRDRNDRRAT